jgi:putative ABC transport system permease protein
VVPDAVLAGSGAAALKPRIGALPGDPVVAARKAVAAAEPVARYDVTVNAGERRFQTLLIGLEPGTVMHRFATTDGDQSLPAEGLLLGQGAQDTLGISTGDPVTVTIGETGDRFTEPVAGFVDEPMNPVAYLSLSHLQQVTASEATGVLLTLKPGAAEESVRERFTAIPDVAAYLSTTSLEAAMREAFTLYDALVGLMLAFAAVMAAALLYNAMWANVAERSVELGTLRAAGMSAGMLSRLVAVENLLLIVLGLPLSLVGGTLLADWYMSAYETQGYHWSLDMKASTPILVAGGVLIATVVAQLPALRMVRRLDLARIVGERSL